MDKVCTKMRLAKILEISQLLSTPWRPLVHCRVEDNLAGCATCVQEKPLFLDGHSKPGEAFQRAAYALLYPGIKNSVRSERYPLLWARVAQYVSGGTATHRSRQIFRLSPISFAVSPLSACKLILFVQLVMNNNLGPLQGYMTFFDCN